MTTKTALLLVLVVTGASVGMYFALRPDSCDGLPREIGACSGNRPVFIGSTCAEVGEEWGRQLDQRVTALMGAPATSGRSSQLLDIEILTIQLANKHMRDTGITPTCDVETFFKSGESRFSEAFIAGVGELMYGGIEHEGVPMADYETWKQRSIDMVALILSNPELPY